MTSPRRPLRILLVDDDPESRVMCTRFLVRMGHDVTVASNSTRAIRLIRDEEWDVVLTDQNTQGATGVDVLERAFKRQPQALRILMSTTLDPRIAYEAQTRAHAHCLIEKPSLDSGIPVPREGMSFPGPLGPFDVRLASG